jgi:hypothetical protein
VLENQIVDLESKLNIFNLYFLYKYRSSAKWKEVIFKIKLTENEYKLLMQEKSKNVLKI